MKFIVALVALFTLALTSGCGKTDIKDSAQVILCQTGKTASTVAAIQLAAELGCADTAAIKLSFEEKLVSLKVCEEKKDATASLVAKSVIADAFCGPVVESLFAGGIAQIPPEWKCTGGNLAADAKAKVIAACLKSL